MEKMQHPPWYESADRITKAMLSCKCGGHGAVRIAYRDPLSGEVKPLPVGHPLFGKAIVCVCRRDLLARQRAERLRRLSGIPDQMLQRMTFASFDPEMCRPASARQAMAKIKTLCQDYARLPRGWLILVGPNGVGKTHLATAIARATLDDDRGCYMASMPDLLDMLRAGYEQQQFEARFSEIRDVGLLVLDDLGAEHSTEWAQEKLYQLVNWRSQRGLPLVVTSNFDPRTDIPGLDKRIRSRLVEGSRTKGGFSRVIVFPCADLRPYVT